MVEPHVGIVVVTYNRLECLKRCVESVNALDYTNYTFYIINNASTDGTDAYCRSLDNGVRYVLLEQNLGGSFGFNRGMRRAYDDGCDVIWGMDDDAYPTSDSLTKLLEAYEKQPRAAYWSNSHSHLDTFKPHAVELVNNWTFVGFFIPRAIVDVVGFPRDDLFVFFDDSEYAKRIVAAGFNIYKVHDSIVIHEGALAKFDDDSYDRRRFLRWEVSVQRLPDWKRYYIYRNRFLVSKSVAQKGRVFLWELMEGAKLAYVHPSSLRLWRKGLVDGVRGLTGKRVDPGAVSKG